MVTFHECQRVLDAGIAAAHDNDGFPLELVGIVKLVLHQRMGFSGNVKLANIALKPDGEDNILSHQGITRCEHNLECTATAIDGRNLRPNPYIEIGRASC